MRKNELYQALKEDGVTFDRPYVNLTGEELQREYDRRFKQDAVAQPEPELQIVPAPAPAPASGVKSRPTPPVAPRDPEEVAGQRLNTKDVDEPIRTDEQGRIWFQEEVAKPSFAKPRGRRVLRYNDPGVEKRRTKNGDAYEEFEVAGTQSIPSEVRITLPSYQVGIYKDPRFPFKVVCYNGVEGFDFFEINEFYGGSELVPSEVKRMYVENVLCYDIRSVVAAITKEDRQNRLAGRGVPIHER